MLSARDIRTTDSIGAVLEMVLILDKHMSVSTGLYIGSFGFLKMLSLIVAGLALSFRQSTILTFVP